MALSQVIRLYGFGSFFERGSSGHDIDLLLVHSNLTEQSINFAIECKSILTVKLPNSDVVMLSQQEERGLRFLDQSRARFLGTVNNVNPSSQIEAIVRTLLRLVI